MNNIFQSKEWEQFKLATGYQKSYWVGDILVLQKNLPLGYSMLYAPMANSESGIWNLESGIKEFSKQIREIARQNNSIFFRLEFNVPVAGPNSKFKILDSRFGFAKAFEEMQPEHTLLLDLSKTEEELLSEMKQKGRYNIKVASKNEVKIHFGTSPNDIDSFYNLYEQTAKRHGITHRAKKYFIQLVEILSQKGYCRVYTAKKTIGGKETDLAAMIMVYSGETAIYMFGASNDDFKNTMAPYLMQWTAIRDAKEEKYKKYDFFGIAPDDNPKHPWAGVTRFKQQFGGQAAQIAGSYDLIIQPTAYQLFKIAEKIRR
ncbi:MAG: peptidoglycan bridge formation glycyltransferase FemA/FemB family protein [Patescibacteria group bacterium]|jgi:lipid II:glycine glycyltransferase (peptidoglycan interpeptide bridge formation enzyme)